MNSTSSLLRAALVLLAVAGIGTWAWRSFGSGSDPASGTPAPSGTEPGHLVLVTYFTTDQRCPTCVKIETQTRKAVTSGFPEELARDQVRFRTVNFDRDEYKHFAEDYDLAFKTVVISNRRRGEEKAWAKFDEVWDLVEEPEAFANYLQDGIRNYLDSGPDA